MNKKLLAVAVAGAIGAPGLALAQAANVNIYGVIDGRVDSMKFSNNGAGTVTGLTKQHVSFQAARWGLRGSENLGGGMTAFFQVESGLSVDGRPNTTSDSAGVYTLGGRDSYLGLRGGWGEVKFGGFGTPYKDSQSFWSVGPAIGHGGIIMGNKDTTGAIQSPNCSGVVNAGTGALTVTTVAAPACLPQVEHNGTAFSMRASNQLGYTSPRFSGFQGKVSVVAPEYAEPSSSTPAGLAQHKPRQLSTNLTWAGGPFSAGIAYETRTGFRASNTALSNRNAKDTGVTIGGKWNYGKGELGLGWERLKYGNAATAAAPNNFTLAAWVINASFKVSNAGTISGGYSKTPGGKSCGAGVVAAAGTCGTTSGANHVTLGYDHSLSKRTALYAIYSKINNNTGASYYYIAGPTGNASAGTRSISAGTDVTTYGLGVKHSF